MNEWPGIKRTKLERKLNFTTPCALYAPRSHLCKVRFPHCTAFHPVAHCVATPRKRPTTASIFTCTRFWQRKILFPFRYFFFFLLANKCPFVSFALFTAVGTDCRLQANFFHLAYFFAPNVTSRCWMVFPPLESSVLFGSIHLNEAAAKLFSINLTSSHPSFCKRTLENTTQ